MPKDRTKPWINVLIYGDKAIVRKMTFQDDERVAAKYGLNATGEWVLIPEATKMGVPIYPDECILPVTFYDEVEDG